uniref:Uncharacterized protein n=1 Tax=Rhizophora mucronata TaxID=61149 RepID=A0A2P2NC70_RHIMU
MWSHDRIVYTLNSRSRVQTWILSIHGTGVSTWSYYLQSQSVKIIKYHDGKSKSHYMH